MTSIEKTFQILNLAVIAISAFFVWLTLHKTNRWNRKKGAQEILDKFVVGEIPGLGKKIRIEFKCKIYDHENDYTKFIKKLKKKDKKVFDDTLNRMLNIFEVIAINIKNKIIKENICYDYMGWIYTEYYRFSIDYIKNKRIEAADNRVLENFEKYAEKWIKKKNC
jgi:Domain of unknown function (DUF4760)